MASRRTQSHRRLALFSCWLVLLASCEEPATEVVLSRSEGPIALLSVTPTDSFQISGAILPLEELAQNDVMVVFFNTTNGASRGVFASREFELPFLRGHYEVRLEIDGKLYAVLDHFDLTQELNDLVIDLSPYMVDAELVAAFPTLEPGAPVGALALTAGTNSIHASYGNGISLENGTSKLLRLFPGDYDLWVAAGKLVNWGSAERRSYIKRANGVFQPSMRVSIREGEGNQVVLDEPLMPLVRSKEERSHFSKGFMMLEGELYDALPLEEEDELWVSARSPVKVVWSEESGYRGVSVVVETDSTQGKLPPFSTSTLCNEAAGDFTLWDGKRELKLWGDTSVMEVKAGTCGTIPDAEYEVFYHPTNTSTCPISLEESISPKGLRLGFGDLAALQQQVQTVKYYKVRGSVHVGIDRIKSGYLDFISEEGCAAIPLSDCGDFDVLLPAGVYHLRHETVSTCPQYFEDNVRLPTGGRFVVDRAQAVEVESDSIPIDLAQPSTLSIKPSRLDPRRFLSLYRHTRIWLQPGQYDVLEHGLPCGTLTVTDDGGVSMELPSYCQVEYFDE